MHLIKIII